MKKTAILLAVIVILLFAWFAVALAGATENTPPRRYPGISTQPPLDTPVPPGDCYIIVRGQIFWYPCPQAVR